MDTFVEDGHRCELVDDLLPVSAPASDDGGQPLSAVVARCTADDEGRRCSPRVRLAPISNRCIASCRGVSLALSPVSPAFVIHRAGPGRAVSGDGAAASRD